MYAARERQGVERARQILYDIRMVASGEGRTGVDIYNDRREMGK